MGQWNVGAAYRPPDTNINASLSYQQGRTNIQISMVPDESASLLGPNGFTGGVGPGNLGLSFNIGYVTVVFFLIISSGIAVRFILTGALTFSSFFDSHFLTVLFHLFPL